MADRSLPASPNWYCSRCSDVSGSGLLGVGARNVVYLIDVSASACRVTGEWDLCPETDEQETVESVPAATISP